MKLARDHHRTAVYQTPFHPRTAPLNVLNLRRWRQGRGHLRKARLHKLERLNNIDIPVEEKTYLRRSTRSFRLDALDAGDTVHRFFDRTGDGDKGLRRRGYAVINDDYDARKIGGGKNRDGQLHGCIQPARADQGYHDQHCARLV